MIVMKFISRFVSVDSDILVPFDILSTEQVSGRIKHSDTIEYQSGFILIPQQTFVCELTSVMEGTITLPFLTK